jgi:chemotaxis protein MotB
MSGNGEEKKSNELVIIKRGHGGEEGGHKGGVWKIAYADFMTAMMAFFLVMWLINSTDKKTLTQVATYFNPLRLTDKTPSTKGLHQMESGAQGSQNDHGNAPIKGDKKGEKQSEGGRADKTDKASEGQPQGGSAQFTEEALFEDPMGVLDKLANQASKEQQQAKAAARAASGRPANGTAYRDPFDPAFRRETHAKAPAPGTAPKPEPSAAGNDDQAAAGRAVEAAKPQPDQPPQPPQAPAAAPVVETPAVETPAPAQPAAVAVANPERAQAERAGAERAGAERAQAERAQAERAQAERVKAERLETEIKQLITQYLSGAIPHVEVTVTEEGLLISLTDDYDFGMFAIASAEPRPAMVVVMEKLARILAGQSERLIVRGHTDGRPYKSATYDNWRLSTARAHMAYYMLVRGGIDEKRFERIEGHADRNLRITNDPEAAQNRRIEILLRKAKP